MLKHLKTTFLNVNINHETNSLLGRTITFVTVDVIIIIIIIIAATTRYTINTSNNNNSPSAFICFYFMLTGFTNLIIFFYKYS
jgi:hypothetical protein